MSKSQQKAEGFHDHESHDQLAKAKVKQPYGNAAAAEMIKTKNHQQDHG